MSDDPFEEVADAKRSLSDEARARRPPRQRDLGKLTARERVDYLLDEGTFEEIGRLASPMPTTPETTDWVREDAPSDGVVTGYGEIDGRSVALIATDFTVKGGSIGHAGGRKMSRVAERALDRGLPLLMLHDGGGHRIQEGLDAAPFARGDNGFSKLQTALSGWVPVVSAMMGPAFAAPTNFAALSDFVPIVEGTGTMGSPDRRLVEAALGVDGTKEELGSARFQTTETGMADLACEDDEACLDAIRTFLSYLPRNARREPPTADSRPPAVDGERLRDHPLEPTKGVRHRRDRRGDRRPGLGVRTEADLRAEHRYRLRSPRGEPIGVIANNPGSRPEPSILAHRRRRPTSRRSATPTGSRSSRWPTYPESCPARTRNARGSLATPRSSHSNSRVRRSRSLTSSSDAATASATWRWAAAARSTRS